MEDLNMQTPSRQKRYQPAYWQPMLPSPLRERAQTIARHVFDRLGNAEQITRIAQQAKQQSTIPVCWRATSLSFGFAGIALAYAYCCQCFPEERYKQAAFRLTTLVSQGIQTEPFCTSGFFEGTTGVATMLTLLSKTDERYAPLAQAVNANLCKQVLSTPYLHDESRGVATQEYDVTNGAAGTLAYLLTLSESDEQALRASNKLIDYLIWLSGFDERGIHTSDRWHIPHERLSTTRKHQVYPRGAYDCGLAHGIAGPLAALACAWLKGRKRPGHYEAINHITLWLMQHSFYDTWGINWSAVVEPGSSQRVMQNAYQKPGRAAWCYGAPGIARAIWLTGLALNKVFLQRVAIQAIEAVLQRPQTHTHIISPTFCHGWAGLLQICLRFAHETDNKVLRASIPTIAEQILSSYHAETPLGFQDVEVEGTIVDQVSWLTGAPGVAMTLLAASTAVEPTWDHALLIS
jgi:lantibiotic biosynthesis protein